MGNLCADLHTPLCGRTILFTYTAFTGMDQADMTYHPAGGKEARYYPHHDQGGSLAKMRIGNGSLTATNLVLQSMADCEELEAPVGATVNESILAHRVGPLEDNQVRFSIMSYLENYSGSLRDLSKLVLQVQIAQPGALAELKNSRGRRGEMVAG